MKVTVNQVVSAQPTLKKLTGQDMPISMAISLLKVCKDTAVHVEAFQAKQLALFENFGDKNEDETQWVVSEERKEEYFEALKEVLDTEVELDFSPVSAVALEDAGVKISVNDMAGVEWLVNEWT